MGLNGNAALCPLAGMTIAIEDALHGAREVALVYAGAFLLVTYLGSMKEVTCP